MTEESNGFYPKEKVPPLVITEADTNKLHGLLHRAVPLPHVEYVVFEGFLEKRGQYNKAYKTRYFILTSKQKLYYYDIAKGSEITLSRVNKTAGSDTALGHPERAKLIELAVHQRYLRGTLDIYEARSIKYDIGTSFNEFTIVYSQREYYLRSSTEDELCKWIKKIREVAAGRYCVTERQFADTIMPIQSQKQQNGRYYQVIANTIVRESVSLKSPKIRILTAGLKVKVIEIQGRRARIVEPVKGWTSLQSSSGVRILELAAGQTPLAAGQIHTLFRKPTEESVGEDNQFHGGTQI